MKEPLTSPEIHFRKRKQSSDSSPFTRSKTRIFSHPNRSGFSRPDPVSRTPVPEMESLLSRKCYLTRDRRHKRVFSSDGDSVPEEENEAENGELKKLLNGFDSSAEPDEGSEVVRSETENGSIDGASGLKDQEIPKIKMDVNGCRRRKVFKTPSSFSYRRLLPHLMEIVNDTSSVSEIEIVEAGSPCKFPQLDGTNLKMRSVAESSYAAKTDYVASQSSDSKPPEDPDPGKVHVNVFATQPDADNDVNGIDASVEERIQTTPPDTSLFAEVEDGFAGLPVDREKNNSGTMKQSPNTKCSSNSMNTSVLNPFHRLKLFKNPRSLSYRRLLPFLMDISKDSSCSLRKHQQKTPQVVAREDKQNDEKKCSEDLIQSNPFTTPASGGSSPDSNNNLVSSIFESSTTNYSSNVIPRCVDSVTHPDQDMLNALPTEETPHSQNKPAKLQLDLGSKVLSTTMLEEPSIVSNDILTQECTSKEPKSVDKQKMCSSMGVELHNGNAESTELVNLEQQAFQIKVSDSLVSPNNRPFKGILKRNRRDCKGLCNCLNCASFRLHAERAFEFSGNQLHDAGEVASELMKELANLRLLLQKSITGNEDSSGMWPNPAVIEQACNKALEAETLAKERLVELNDELRVHCKTPVCALFYDISKLSNAVGSFQKLSCITYLSNVKDELSSDKLDELGSFFISYFLNSAPNPTR